ncbi:MAG: response regulator, partial [Myxococcales bacterium]|nr:response regulator [Myxococcales bacterium]
MTDERGGPFGPEEPPESASPSTQGPASTSTGTSSPVGGPGGGASFAAGGAAADFVSSLGRKVQEMRGPLEALRAGRERARPREDLRRRLHAVGTGARLFHFDALAQAVSAATRAIDEAAVASDSLPESLLADLEHLVEGLPALAWHKGPAPLDMLPAARPPRPATGPSLPWTVLLVGDETLALALEDDPATFPCDIERTVDLGPVVELARALAPDLVVIDVDLPGALDALASLVDDAFTGPVPIVAVGRELGGSPGDSRPKPAARLVALGVARALDKPFSPTTLREACADAVGERSVAIAAPHAIAVGAVTPEALAERLVAELRRLLIDDLEPFSREAVVDLGSGAEVLGPMWGALAKVRDVVAHKSEGRIAYRGLRLDRPIALDAPLSGSFDEGARRGPSRRTFDVDLEGRTIVVADDDPAVRRFLAGSLRSAGATVIEAEDGDEALRRAREHGADLLVVDVVMPGRDGASVARAVHHDPALRDRPVILLSWKEDLLRRLRDLRAGSAGALRKDEDASVVVARAREALVSRVRVEARLAQGAEVRGRLDDLSTTSLLLLVQRLREQACVIVRDATFVWEAELENGSLVRLSRTQGGRGGADFARGPALLPSLLGVVGGRFLVRGLPPRDPASASPSSPLHVDLD